MYSWGAYGFAVCPYNIAMSYNWSHLRCVPPPLPREEDTYLLNKQRFHNAALLCAVFQASRKMGYSGDLTILTELLEIRRYLHLKSDEAKQLRWRDMIGHTVHVQWLPEQSYIVEEYICWNEVKVRLPSGELVRRSPEILVYESLLLGAWQAGRLRERHEYEMKKALRAASPKTKKGDEQTRYRPTAWDNEPQRGDDSGS